METCKVQINDIVVDTLQKLNEVFVDLGYSEEVREKEWKILVDDTREFFLSKLLPKLALRGMNNK